MNAKLKKAFPLQSGEIERFFTLAIMMALIVYVYSVQRNAKDAFIISILGTELISTIKLYGTLVGAIIFMIVYSKMVDLMNRTQIFHILNISFISFFLLFTVILYPNLDAIRIDSLSLIEEKVFFLKYIIMMIKNWPLSLYYIISELWGSAMLSLIFWQIANQIVNINESKRFYPLFGCFAQLGLILSGTLTQVFTSSKTSSSGWQESLNRITGSVVIAGILISLCMLCLTIRTEDKSLINGSGRKKNKKKVSFLSGLKYVFSSNYIFLIALLSICYGTSINLVEGVWKKSLELMFIEPMTLSNFMGKQQLCTGIATIIAMLAGVYILRLMSWRTAALLTPCVISLTGMAFFIFAIFGNFFKNQFAFNSIYILNIMVYAGLSQNVLSKATKYSFFDPTKEMLYIPLDDELKSKGKAAADVVGARLGKSGGAIIQFTLLSIIPGSSLIDLSYTKFSLAPILGTFFVLIMIIWFFTVFKLSKCFEDSTNK